MIGGLFEVALMALRKIEVLSVPASGPIATTGIYLLQSIHPTR